MPFTISQTDFNSLSTYTQHCFIFYKQYDYKLLKIGISESLCMSSWKKIVLHEIKKNIYREKVIGLSLVFEPGKVTSHLQICHSVHSEKEFRTLRAQQAVLQWNHKYLNL